MYILLEITKNKTTFGTHDQTSNVVLEFWNMLHMQDDFAVYTQPASFAVSQFLDELGPGPRGTSSG